MPRLANHTVECEGCDELVSPEEATKRQRYGLIGLILIGVVGVLAGSTIGIATAGLGIAATVPLGLIGSYSGWKLGAGWAEFRDGVNCPECEYVFGGYGEVSLPGGGKLSLPSVSGSDTEDSDTVETAFRVGFECGNCGLEWAHGFASGTQVTDPAEKKGVVVSGSADRQQMQCPTCEAVDPVAIVDRNPADSVTTDNSGLLARFVNGALFVWITLFLGLAAAYVSLEALGVIGAFGIFLLVAFGMATIWELYDVRIID